MKNWKAKELYDNLLLKANDAEMREFYKALLAKELDIKKYSDEVDEKLTYILNKYEYYISPETLQSIKIDYDLIGII